MANVNFNGQSASGGASSLNQLTDVSIITPSDGQCLIYDTNSSEWVNGTGNPPSISMTASTDGTSLANPTVTVTKTGTDESPNFDLAFSGLKGDTGAQGATGATGATGNGISSIVKTSTVGLVDTYTITYTDGTTSTFTVTNGQSINSINDISDVTLTTPTNGQVLTYNSTSQKWENKAQAGGSLANLTDVTLTTPANGNTLRYNSTSQKWENVSLSKSDVGLGNVDNTSDLNKPISTATQTALDAKASNTDVNNKHKVTSKTVNLTGWTSDTTSQSGTTLYKKSISLSHVYVDSPTVDIGAASGSVLPTTAQQTAYDLLQYVTIDGTTLYLYASDVPTTAFYINVEGVD